MREEELEMTFSRCLKGDIKAQKHLFLTYQPLVKSICYRYIQAADIDDVAQEIWVKIFTNLKKYDSKQASLSTWIGRIGINHCIDRLRKNKYLPITESIEELHLVEDAKEALDEMELVQYYMKKLPRKLYVVFNLNVIDGFSHTEIAALLGITVVGSRKRLSRAKEMLKTLFSKEKKTL